MHHTCRVAVYAKYSRRTIFFIYMYSRQPSDIGMLYLINDGWTNEKKTWYLESMQLFGSEWWIKTSRACHCIRTSNSSLYLIRYLDLSPITIYNLSYISKWITLQRQNIVNHTARWDNGHCLNIVVSKFNCLWSV